MIGFVALGLVIGAVGTLIGAGGGFILMPVLVMLFPRAEPEHLAAISLAVVCANATSGTIGYARLGRVDYRGGSLFAAAAVPGAVLGSLLVHWIPRHAFDVTLGIGLCIMAVWLLVRHRAPASHGSSDRSPGQHDTARAPMTPVQLKRGIGISAVVGAASSILGIGGGIIHVPALVHAVGYPVHVATATSHFVLAITSGVAVVVLASRGLLEHDLNVALLLAAGAVIGAQIGARLSKRVSGPWIIRALAVALLLVGGRVLWGATHRPVSVTRGVSQRITLRTRAYKPLG